MNSSEDLLPIRSILVSEDVEAKVYSFSQFISCVDLYLRGDCVRSFCSDRLSVEEWLEEPDTMLSFLK